MTAAEMEAKVRRVLVLTHELCPERNDASELGMYVWGGILSDLPMAQVEIYIERLRTLLQRRAVRGPDAS